MHPGIDLKSAARNIFRQTLAGIDIAQTVRDKLTRSGSRIECAGARIDLASYKKIRVIALGKASYAMTEGLAGLLAPEYPLTGIVVGPTAPPRPIAGFEIFVAGHPVPNDQSFASARAILQMLRESDRTDALIFFLISGGGSSLVELPLDPAISLEDFQTLHRALVGCGASIEEINCVRKHLSAVKGGRLAAAAPDAMKITLGVTDVPQGRESALASGPTLPDPTTAADARRIAGQYSLLPELPHSIRANFTHPGSLVETPKQNHPAFRTASFEILLGMHDLFHHAHLAAESEGFHTICDNCTDDWPIERAAEFLVGELTRLSRELPNQPVALVADGEVSSPVRGGGVGGRNSALVLECVPRIAGRRMAALSAGTDGIDGSSLAAGAIADGETLARATGAGLDPQAFARRSDSYTFFNALGDAIVTGPTGNNLRDLRIFLAAPEPKI
jgi:hydroxypyruvate reductase